MKYTTVMGEKNHLNKLLKCFSSPTSEKGLTEEFENLHLLDYSQITSELMTDFSLKKEETRTWTLKKISNQFNSASLVIK